MGQENIQGTDYRSTAKICPRRLRIAELRWEMGGIAFANAFVRGLRTYVYINVEGTFNYWYWQLKYKTI